MQRTKIAWTEVTWNPWSGCEKISPGCTFCYAHTLAENKRGTAAFPNGFDLTIRPGKLLEPLELKAPSLIFVNSMSDFFLEGVTDALRDQVVDVMKKTPHHEYQVLTKRETELLRYSRRRKLPPNFWAGVSVENQDYVHRIDVLREVEADVRFLSLEPLLGPIEFPTDGIHWVIAGGESGLHLPKAANENRSLVKRVAKAWIPKPECEDWVRSIRDQCIAADIPFFFKQWGGPRPKSGGETLDGRMWEEYPRLPHVMA